MLMVCLGVVAGSLGLVKGTESTALPGAQKIIPVIELFLLRNSTYGNRAEYYLFLIRIDFVSNT